MDHREPSIGTTRRSLLARAAVLGAALAGGCAATITQRAAVTTTVHLLTAPKGVTHDSYVAALNEELREWATARPEVTALVLHDLTPGRPHPLIAGEANIRTVDAMIECAWSGSTSPGLVPTAASPETLAMATVSHHGLSPATRGKALIALLFRPDGWTHAQFVDHWFNTHGTMAARVPRVEGLILNAIDAPAPAGTRGTDLLPLAGLDGIAQSYRADFDTPLTSPEAKQWYADGAKMIGRSISYRSVETVIR